MKITVECGVCRRELKVAYEEANEVLIVSPCSECSVENIKVTTLGSEITIE